MASEDQENKASSTDEVELRRPKLYFETITFSDDSNRVGAATAKNLAETTQPGAETGASISTNAVCRSLRRQ